jgi:catechol 2,3-dioxygenase-like lactoylglutathione lyase family enzyme
VIDLTDIGRDSVGQAGAAGLRALPILGAMPFTEVFAAVAVRDRDAAIEFYERLLGARPTMLPNDDEAAWQLTRGGWLYVLRDADRAGSSVVTLLVDDLDERLAVLAARGIEPGPVGTVAGDTRTTWITDLDGNRVQIAQPG